MSEKKRRPTLAFLLSVLVRYDSRFKGPVPLARLTGRLRFVYWGASWDRIGTDLLEKPSPSTEDASP